MNKRVITVKGEIEEFDRMQQYWWCVDTFGMNNDWYYDSTHGIYVLTESVATLFLLKWQAR